MLNNLKKKTNERGFTIIEVMIVLAIAGLIILIVLLAVPALQRNGRNTAIKNDVSAIAAAVAEYGSNNEGAIPSTAAKVAGSSVVSIGGAGTAAEAKVQASTDVSTGTAPSTNAGVIQVRYQQKCANSTSFAVNPSTRSTAILYNIETASGVAPRCVDA